MAIAMSTPPMVGVPDFFRCDCGPSSRMNWPIWKFAQLPDDPRADEQRNQQRRARGEGGAEREGSGRCEKGERTGNSFS